MPQAAVASHEIEVARECREKGAQKVDGEIFHGVGKSTLLHVHGKQAVHRKFKEFPHHPDGSGKTYGKKCNVKGTEDQMNLFVSAQCEGDQKPDYTEQNA